MLRHENGGAERRGQSSAEPVRGGANGDAEAAELSVHRPASHGFPRSERSLLRDGVLRERGPSELHPLQNAPLRGRAAPFRRQSRPRGGLHAHALRAPPRHQARERAADRGGRGQARRLRAEQDALLHAQPRLLLLRNRPLPPARDVPERRGVQPRAGLVAGRLRDLRNGRRRAAVRRVQGGAAAEGAQGRAEIPRIFVNRAGGAAEGALEEESVGEAGRGGWRLFGSQKYALFWACELGEAGGVGEGGGVGNADGDAVSDATRDESEAEGEQRPDD